MEILCVFWKESYYYMSNEEQEYIKKLGKSGVVVSKLMADLYGKGYHLYVYNWYTSEKLFRHLQENGTAACGTAMVTG